MTIELGASVRLSNHAVLLSVFAAIEGMAISVTVADDDAAGFDDSMTRVISDARSQIMANCQRASAHLKIEHDAIAARIEKAMGKKRVKG